MSLLMEALKKAEEAKRKAIDNSEATPPGTIPPLALIPDAPSPSKPSNGSPLPDLSLHIASVDADLAAVSTEPPPRRRTATTSSKSGNARSEPRASDREDRATVQNAFAAKKANEPRNGLWILIGIGGAALLAIAAYFWWQLNGLSSAGNLRPAVSQPPAPSIARPEPTPANPPEAKRPEPVSLAATGAAQSANAESLRPPSRSPAPSLPMRVDSTQSATQPAATPSTTARQKSTTASAVEEPPVRLSRTEPAANPTLEHAYDDLQAGHLDQAQRGYELALRRDPLNTDALLGLATIASRQGQRDRARAFYERALESDPTDATAQAGLLNAAGQSDPAMSESRLKLALASQPNSPAVLFALGNLYAREARWSEAQQAYFQAYGTTPDNADFIFNLAVSLDHLRQSKLAAQYYRMALEAPTADHASFDKNQAQRRILELQP
ncbi:tetratricopeptide repeat protein [Propionivibrio soli]|uniref:tetratricopeptide repeat protein n=1 Tax=Propionivibrio soli TaxID=2976531 RepID=UPI0021E9346C|nr:tetratricopeptide repeat protein [Propionivibrio soli]